MDFNICFNNAAVLLILFWNTHLDVSCVPLTVPPRAANAGESSFGMVKLPVVGVEEKCGERLLQVQVQEVKFHRKPQAAALLSKLQHGFVFMRLKWVLTILSIHISVE